MTMAFRPANVCNAIGKIRTFDWSPSYGVTEFGDVINLRTSKRLKPARRARGGYLCVSLSEQWGAKTWFVHQIVALAFHGPRPARHDAAHRDGNKLNNHYTNVRWATRSENEQDKIEHGTSNRGDRNGMSAASRRRRAV